MNRKAKSSMQELDDAEGHKGSTANILYIIRKMIVSTVDHA